MSWFLLTIVILAAGLTCLFALCEWVVKRLFEPPEDRGTPR